MQEIQLAKQEQQAAQPASGKIELVVRPQPNVTISGSTTIAGRFLPSTFSIQTGPYWRSLDFFCDAANALSEHIGPNQIGELNLHGDRYVVMRRQLFNNLYGLAQSVDNLRNGLLLYRRQIQMAARLPANTFALNRISDLALKFPDLQTVSARTFPELVFDEDERVEVSSSGNEEDDYEIDPAKVWQFDPEQRHGIGN